MASSGVMSGGMCGATSIRSWLTANVMERCGRYSQAPSGASSPARPSRFGVVKPAHMIARVASPGGPAASLLAISDLHITYPENRRVVESLRSPSPGDWLIVCGDVSELSVDLEWALGLLRERFAAVVWVPGNHDLWSVPEDPLELRGAERYRHLVAVCRRLGVLTPEDPYPVWEGAGGPVTVAPLFLLYDYSFGRNIAPTKEQALARAYAAGVVCSDELVLHPDPFPSREAWCEARVRETELRLAALDPALATVLVNHFPLTRDPTLILRHP